MVPLTDTGQYAECEDGLRHHPSPVEQRLKPQEADHHRPTGQ